MPDKLAQRDASLEHLLAECAKEPIHIPGSIQSFGTLLMWDHHWQIIAIAEGKPRLFSPPLKLHLGQTLDNLFGSESAKIRILADKVIAGSYLQIALSANDQHQSCEGRIHAMPFGWILELWPTSSAIMKADTNGLADWLRDLEQDGELQPLAERLCQEVRNELAYDRVLIYQFDPSFNGEVIAEAVREDFPSYRGLWYPASDIPAQARELYLKNRVRLLVDRDAPAIKIEPQLHPRTGEAWDLSHCLLRSMSPIHLQYLRNMGVAASLVASVVVQGKLWGLIACHHEQPYYPPGGALERLGNWASLLGLAIERISECKRRQGSALAQEWLRQILTAPNQSEDWTELLVGSQASLLKVISADGIALVHGTRVHRQGRTPDESHCRLIRDWLNRQNDLVFHTDRLGQLEPSFADSADVAAGIMALKLPRLEDSWLIWFRGELRQQVRWAGNPNKPLGESNGLQRLQPRASFEAWQTEVVGQSRAWSASDEAICREAIRLNLLDVLVDWQQRHVQRLSAYQQVLLEQVGDGIYLMDADGVVQYVNPAGEDLFGRSLPDVVGRRLPELYESPQREELEEILQQVKLGRCWQGERLSTRNRRGPRWVDSLFQRIDIGTTETYGIIEISRDATQRKQAQLELQEREQLLRDLVEHIGAGVVVFRPDGTVRMANRYAARLLRLRYEEVLRFNILENFIRFWDENEQPISVVDCPVRKALQQKASQQSMELGYSPHGRPDLVWFSCHLEPEFNTQGDLSYLVWTFSDSTLRRRALLTLRDREELYRLLAENATDLITALDNSRRLVYISPMCLKLLGLNPEQMLGRQWKDFVHPDDQSAWANFINTNSNSDRHKLEYRIIHASGQTCWVETSANLQLDRPESRIVCVTRDISERRYLQEQQRRLVKFEALGSLSGQVAHDFNNLLTVIMGACAEAFAAPDPRQPLADIQKAVEQGVKLTRQLLNFSRTQPTRFQELLLDATIRGLHGLLERLAGDNMQIILDLNASNGLIWADQGQFEQALFNLVSNARDAMSRRGTIEIVTRAVHLEHANPLLSSGQKPGAYLRLSVIDQGCGMDETTQQKIFEPFFTTKGEGQGTGLGMSIIQHLVASTHGMLKVTSKLNQGTTMDLYFPCKTTTIEAPQPATPAISQRSTRQNDLRAIYGSGQRILLVEDNVYLRQSTMRLLKHAGYEVQAVETPHAAIQLVEVGQRFDLILSDVVLPKMSGPELFEKLKHQLPNCPVLFMSGHAPEETGGVNSASRKSHFLQKPFTTKELLEAVRTCLQGEA